MIFGRAQTWRRGTCPIETRSAVLCTTRPRSHEEGSQYVGGQRRMEGRDHWGRTLISLIWKVLCFCSNCNLHLNGPFCYDYLLPFQSGDVIYSKVMPGARRVLKLEAVLEASVDELYDLLFVNVEVMHLWNPSVQQIKVSCWPFHSSSLGRLPIEWFTNGETVTQKNTIGQTYSIQILLKFKDLYNCVRTIFSFQTSCLCFLSAHFCCSSHNLMMSCSKEWIPTLQDLIMY